MKCCLWVSGQMIAVALLTAPPAGGQTTPSTTPPAATNAQDYSQGFRAFLRLGLPDTSKATYVNLQSVVLHQFGGYSLHEVQLRGNAWLLAENKAATSTLLTASGVVMELADEQTFRKQQMAAMASNAVARAGTVVPRQADVPTGSWKPCDLERDLGKATAFVEKKLAEKAANARGLRYDSFLRSDEGPGKLFLLAVLAWQHGRQQEANALAGSLFALAGDSRKVILSAMNVLADAQLAAAGIDFRFTRDWQAYQAAVAALLQKFPAGWRKAGAARLLQVQVQARAAMQAPPPVTGEGLDDEDRALAAALATEAESGSRHGYSGDFWFLVASNRVSRRPTASEPPDVLTRIQARGLRSVPLLLALAGDEVLCPRFRSESGMSTIHTFYENDSGPSDEVRTHTYYRQMDRPLTRGEIARHLLAPLCPREESERRRGDDEQTPEEVVEAARETYLALKALPPTGQADYFLKHGDQNQKQAAIRFLLESGVEAHVPQIEAFLLTPPEMSHMMHGGHGGGLVSEYVEKRGEAAAGFVERYAAMRQKFDLPAGMASDEEIVAHMRKMVDREVAALRAMVRKPDLEATIAALVNADSDQKGMMVAYQTLGRLPADTAVPAMLRAAVQSTNTVVRSRLLQMMPMLRLSGMQESMEELMEEVDSPEAMEAVMQQLAARNQASIGTNAAAWKFLLADTRPAVPTGMEYGDTRKMTLADLAATAIETLYSGGSSMRSFGAGNTENLPVEVMMRVMRDRAAARLAGKPEAELPRLPSADDVTEERRAALVASVTQATPAELPMLLAAFSPAETLYLAQAAEEQPALAKALAAPSRHLAKVEVDPALPTGVTARLKRLEGSAISTNAVETMRDCCQFLLTNGVASSLNLSSAGFGCGLSLVVRPLGEPGARGMGTGWISQFNRKGSKPKGVITAMLQGGEEGFAHAMWIVELPPAAAPVGAATVEGDKAKKDDEDEDDNDNDNEEMMERMMESFEERNQAFNEAARSFCTGSAPLAGNAAITFTGMLPPKPGEKSDKDDDDEDMGMILDGF